MTEERQESKIPDEAKPNDESGIRTERGSVTGKEAKVWTLTGLDTFGPPISAVTGPPLKPRESVPVVEQAALTVLSDRVFELDRKLAAETQRADKLASDYKYVTAERNKAEAEVDRLALRVEELEDTIDDMRSGQPFNGGRA